MNSKVSRILVLLLVGVIVSTGVIPRQAISEEMTLERLMEKYPQYGIEDGTLDIPDKKISKKYMGDYYVSNYTVVPLLAGVDGRKNDTPFLALVFDSGSKNCANYISVDTGYAVYEFQAKEIRKAGKHQPFSLLDRELIQMVREMTVSEKTEISMRTKKNGKAVSFELSDRQKELLTDFYDAYNVLLGKTNVTQAALVMSLLSASFDYKVHTVRLKSLQAATTTPNPEATEYTQEGLGEQEAMKKDNLSLHAGVQLGMGIREVAEKEAAAGNELINKSKKYGGKTVTVQNAETVDLPYGMLYYEGKVAGGDGQSHANFSFSEGSRILTALQYYIHSAEKDSKKMSEKIVTMLKDKYGDPIASKTNKKMLDVDKSVSEVVSAQDVTLIDDYSQWLIELEGGSKVLIEYIYKTKPILKGMYNTVKYVLLDHDFASNPGGGSMEDDL